MTHPDPTETAARIATPILEFGRGWMIAPGTIARAGELGLPAETPFGFWVNGRAGALGDVPAAVAAHAIGFMAPDMVERLWESRPESMTALDAAHEYANAAASWGRTQLVDMDEADLVELAELCTAVSGAATPSVGALFAGWRELAMPEDPAGAATIALNVVRELRGGAYLAAVHATGMGPLGAIISTDDPIRGGSSWATTFGWSAPWPEPDSEARSSAEEITNQIVASVIADALDGPERSRLVELVGAARAGMDR